MMLERTQVDRIVAFEVITTGSRRRAELNRCTALCRRLLEPLSHAAKGDSAELSGQDNAASPAFLPAGTARGPHHTA